MTASTTQGTPADGADAPDEQRSREELSADFRAAFRHHPGGIAIIAAASESGPVGMTASSVASVSVTPTTLLFSLMRSSRSAVVNAAHADLARAFADSRAPRFTPDQGWDYLADGTPVLTDASASLIGHVTHTVELGEAVVVVAEITEVRPGDPGDGLVYRNRAFHVLAEDGED
jgi:flavin reductase (DIM6/NTAB) family NADH-FMN oxidoreductase RutF